MSRRKGEGGLYRANRSSAARIFIAGLVAAVLLVLLLGLAG